jgi:hypothetical protein
MELDIGSFDSFMAYLRFDFWAFILPFILVSLVLAFVTYKRGKEFINQEVTEGVSRRAIREEGYYKRNKIDVYVFIASLSGIILVVIQYLKIPITVSRFFGGFIFTVTPFMFWLGGSSVGSRLVRIIPLKLEGSFLRLPVFRDVKRIIKSGLRRRGDTERLAMIIILTLAIASLATIQGNTEEIQAQRELEWHVGADWQVNFVLEDNHHANLSKITGFDSSIAVNTMDTLYLSSEIPVVAFENHQELINFKNGKPTLKWQQDTFDAFTPQSALQALEDTPNGIFLPSDQFLALDIDVGDIIEMKVPIAGSVRGETVLVENIEVLGVISQVPGGIYFHSLISQDLFQKFHALSLEMPADSFIDLALNASRYLVRTDAGSSISSSQIDEIQHVLDTEMEGIRSHRSYYEELAEINTKKQGYGITGLLSLDFIISLIAVIISAFSFTAILMERRKQEFAILRAIGAKKKHIYKMALGENSLMMMTATIWGIFIGVGVAYLFNGIFLVIALLLGSQSSVNRMVVLPLGELAIISVITFIGMLIATLLSVRSAANQDLSLATKVV